MRRITCSFIAVLLLALLAGCIHDPVGEDYYLDPGLIEGGEKPTPPVIDDITFDTEESQLRITFTGSTDPEGSELLYLLYSSSEDPSAWPEEEYYRIDYYVGYVSEVAILLINVYGSGSWYFWMTAWDGGRESDYSNVYFIEVVL